MFPEYDLELQRRVMQTVAAHTEVPVPEVLAHETDAEWLGSPFLLMRRVDGIVPSDIPPYTMAGWLFEASEADQRKLERESVRVLARLHALHARDARPRVPRPPAVRRAARSTSTSTTSAGTTTGRATARRCR